MGTRRLGTGVVGVRARLKRGSELYLCISYVTRLHGTGQQDDIPLESRGGTTSWITGAPSGKYILSGKARAE